jgi:hypothetical protein
MDTLTLNNISYNNWKEYIFNKFGDKSTFIIEQIEKENKSFDIYRVTLINEKSQTEIIVQIFLDTNYTELHDVQFNNPNSPRLTESNKSNDYGFDGLGSTFNQKNLEDLDDWINIPICHGWTEKTIYYQNKELKTNCYWIHHGQTVEIPIKQNYLENLGCLFFPIIPLKIYLTDLKLKRNNDKVRVEEKVIEPMIKR